MICCSLVRGSTWRSTVYTARSWCSVRQCQVFAPFQSWDQNPSSIFSFCPLCHSAPPLPSGITGIPSSKGSPAWEIPRLLIGFTNISCLLLPPVPHMLIRDGGTMPGREQSPPKAPNAHKGPHLLHIRRGWVGLHLTNHSL